MFKYIPPDLDLCLLSIHEREGYVKVALPIDGAPTGVNPYTTNSSSSSDWNLNNAYHWVYIRAPLGIWAVHTIQCNILTYLSYRIIFSTHVFAFAFCKQS